MAGPRSGHPRSWPLLPQRDQRGHDDAPSTQNSEQRAQRGRNLSGGPEDDHVAKMRKLVLWPSFKKSVLLASLLDKCGKVSYSPAGNLQLLADEWTPTCSAKPIDAVLADSTTLDWISPVDVKDAAAVSRRFLCGGPTRSPVGPRARRRSVCDMGSSRRHRSGHDR